jgi:hypothetical protein
LGHLDARQRPVGFAQRLVAFEAQLDQLPAGHRLAIDQAHRRKMLSGSSSSRAVK